MFMLLLCERDSILYCQLDDVGQVTPGLYFLMQGDSPLTPYQDRFGCVPRIKVVRTALVDTDALVY